MSEDITYSRAERKRFWQEPGVQQWVEFLNKEFPQHQWRRSGEHKLVGRCLLHADSSPSAYIDLNNQFYKCLGCNKFHADPVRLYAESTKKTYTVAFKDLIVLTFGLKVLKSREKELEAFDGYQEMMFMFSDVASDLLRKASLNYGDEKYAFARSAVAYLTSRGVNPERAASRGVGIFPRVREVYEFCNADMDKYQRAYALFGDYFKKNGLVTDGVDHVGKYGGTYLTFPHFTAPDIIGRVKIRNVSGSHSYSRWIGPGTEQGFFGLNHYPTLIGNDKRLSLSETVYIVEGEFDQLSMFHEMEKQGGIDTIVISGSGAAVGGVEDLPSYGFKNIVAVGDYDEGGRKFVERVFTQAPNSSGSSFFAFQYPDPFTEGTDPDEIVKAGQFNIFKNELHDKSNWKESYEWGALQVAETVRKDPTLDLGSRLRMVRNYGDLIPEGPLRGEFISQVATTLGLSEAQLRQDMASSDTEAGFVLSIKRELSKLFTPLVVEHDFTVLCYSKVNNMLFPLPTKRQRDMVLRLQNYCFETDSFSWVSHTLGIPEFITEDPMSKKSFRRLERQQYKDVEEYVYRATDSYLSEQARPIDQFEVRRQGVHFFDADKDLMDIRELPPEFSKQRLVIVNGLDVYIGELTREDEENEDSEIADKVVYRKLDMPVHSKYLLETSDRKYWSDAIMDEASLNETVTFEEFQDAVHDIQRVVDVFNWEHPSIQKIYAPCFMAILPLAMMAENFPLDANQGPSQSGKSTWIKQVLRNSDGYGLVEHTTGYDDYTAAGLAQAAGGSSLLMCIDEFEDADDATAGRRSAVVQDSLEMFRNVAEGAVQTRGTQSGENREEYLRFPISIACIQPFKREEDLNRWVISKLSRPADMSEPPAAVRIRQLLSKERCAEIRRIMTLYPLQNAGMFYKLQKEVSKEVFEEKKVVCREYRFLHSITPLLAVAKHLGWDYIEYAQTHVKLHEENLDLSVLSEEDRLFRAVFQTKAIRLHSEGNSTFTVLEILNDADLAQKLNGANCGVYHIPEKDYVVIDSYSAAVNILQYNHVYRNIVNTHSVFQRLKRHPDVIHDPKFLMEDQEMLNLLNVYISRTPVEELLTVKLNTLRRNSNAISEEDQRKASAEMM